MLVINLLNAPAIYPLIDGDSPNGMIIDFVRVNLYVSVAGIFWSWLRKADSQWTQEVALAAGYYSFDRDGAGIEVRSQNPGLLATVTIELIEESDMPDIFLTQ
jgi:hypothetical protein